jgi:hypothetical protein
VFAVGGVVGLRWDPLFLLPMNQPAQRLTDAMLTTEWNQKDLTTLALVDEGDTLIVDNWRFLHGRSTVKEADVDRHIERVYLSDLYS